MINSKYLYIFAVITLLFATIFAFIKIKDTVFFDIPKGKIKVIEPKSININNKLWLKEIEDNSTKGDFLADEFHLNWDLVSPEFTKERVFIIEYFNIDKYKYSCLKQLLDKYKVTAVVDKNQSMFSVDIKIKDQKTARALMLELDKYDISGKYREIYQYKD